MWGQCSIKTSSKKLQLTARLLICTSVALGCVYDSISLRMLGCGCYLGYLDFIGLDVVRHQSLYNIWPRIIEPKSKNGE